ncbi:MAG TPA: GyrI-like domain-containing protein [Ferruginibacter sp.]|nr:GyrI-like domain-containing protein [Ferruginibacter sp.]
MVYKKPTSFLFFTVVISFMIPGCNNKKNTDSPKKDSIPLIKKDTSQISTGKPTSPPIINITDTIAKKLIVVYIKDSSSTSEGISTKLAAIFRTRLPEYAKTQDIKITGPPMAWYKSHKAPFFFEAGYPVDKKPLKSVKNILVKNIGGDSAVVAHFYGPYEYTIMGYEAIKDWLKSNKKKSSAPPYEVYINDPFDRNLKARDPYRVQTDIIFPRK